MFTGIVLETARVIAVQNVGSKGLRLEVESALREAASWPLGASIAINGLCLTIVESTENATTDSKASRILAFEASEESLSRSNLGTLRAGSLVHLEPALLMGASLGGHLVSGHIDGPGTLSSFESQGEFRKYEFELEGESRARIAPYLVEKGSIAVDGVSLTVNGVRDKGNRTYFDVVLIPHTLQQTRFGGLQVGDKVNLEADLLAKYVNRYTQFWSQEHASEKF